MARIWSREVPFAAAISLALIATGCGDDDGSSSTGADAAAADAAGGDADMEEFNEAVNEAIGAGGGGELTWDGTVHPIESVVCMLDGPRIDVGTVGDGFRILISGDEPYDLQVLGADSQWSGERDESGTRAGVARSGSTFTGDGTFFDIHDSSTTVEASFVIECP